MLPGFKLGKYSNEELAPSHRAFKTLGIENTHKKNQSTEWW
jgi:hypothetical protein